MSQDQSAIHETSSHQIVHNNRQGFLKDSQSNNLLLFYQGKNKPTFYLPTFVRIKVLGISQIKHIQMSSVLNVQIRITINYKGIQTNWKNQLLNEGIRLCFEKDDSILLKREDTNIELYDDEQNSKFQFVIRRFVSSRMECNNLEQTPFQTLRCKIRLCLNKVSLDFNKAYKKIQELYSQKQYQGDQKSNKLLQFHFNMMDNDKIEKKMITSSSKQFGLFQIFQEKFKVVYTCNKIIKNKKNKLNKLQVEGEQKISLLNTNRINYQPDVYEAFKYAHYDVYLFKKPWVAIITIFFPLILLAILNLGIFFQDNDLHKRILSIGALLVSFVALIPVIRQQIPPTPNITIVEILVFVEALTTIMALIDSLQIQDQPQGYQHADVLTQPLFLASLITTIIINLIVLFLTLRYCYKHPPSLFSRLAKQKNKQLSSQKKNAYRNVEFNQWYNSECDAYFRRIIDNGNIKIHKSQRQFIDIIDQLKDKSLESPLKTR